ncbi:class I SAM-dependent methyltransferase [Flavobacterium sp.]|uniref:class I SAM-dependent methyltransferase n=1 Tax=Flavobacterium sp. TaxID=239 RepID=UPI0040347928
MEKKHLHSVNKIHCDTDDLLGADNVRLKEIFEDPELRKSWDEAKVGLEAFLFPETSGGVNKGDRRALFYIINKFRPFSVLEIGTHVGASTLQIASALNTVHGTNAKLTTVDILDVNDEAGKRWLKFGTKFSPLQNITKSGFHDFVKFVNSPSIPFAESCNERFDLIFLDGSHQSDVVYREIPMALNLLNKNGIILLHDYFPDMKPLWSNGNVIPGPYLAVNRLIKEGMKAHVIPFGELPWNTKLNSNITSLAILVKN